MKNNYFTGNVEHALSIPFKIHNHNSATFGNALIINQLKYSNPNIKTKQITPTLDLEIRRFTIIKAKEEERESVVPFYNVGILVAVFPKFST